MTGKYYWFSYPTKGKEFREQRYASHVDIHRVRDPIMMLTLAATLQQSGLKFGGVITNIRSLDLNRHEEQITDYYPILRSADVVVLPTRPPLTYKNSDRIPSIVPSASEIEFSVLKASKMFFKQLSRREAELAPRLAEQCSGRAATFTSLQFQLYGGAGIDAAGLRHYSMVYLFSVASAFKQGARLLAAFGMGGHETFVWSQALRDNQTLVEEFLHGTRPRFVMALIKPPRSVPYPYLQYEDVSFEIIADLSLPD